MHLNKNVTLSYPTETHQNWRTLKKKYTQEIYSETIKIKNYFYKNIYEKYYNYRRSRFYRFSRCKRICKKQSGTTIINLDALTYAGNLENLKDIENEPNYVFEKADITKPEELRKVFEKYNPDAVVHLAAESHVDRSITDPMAFINTNVNGTANLLNLCKEFWTLNPDHTHGRFPDEKRTNLFYHVSTDEVYGSLGETGFF
jgi:dTDP-D-glucose 4,6-dehydratase